MSRILITSALPYINGVKHLGNLAGSMLPADVYARYNRAAGHEVLFICATDEHGTPAELAAIEAGQSVADYCTEQHEIQKRVGAGFSLSFDHFGRSSNRPNRELTQHFADVLEDKGLIDERTSKQVYSVDDKRFLPDRYVEGTCPNCGYEKARGDQCDNCGTLLDPIELINPYSSVSGSRNVEIRDTRHLYLLQEKMQDAVRKFVDDRAKNWPNLTTSIAYKWLDEGLIARSITRDLSWGIPVTRNGKPRPGFENKVFYVWFDAPVEYIGSTVEWAEANNQNWERWWRTDKGASDVTYVEFMGKDNVAFHTVSFPVTILGSEEPWKLVDKLKAFNWLNWYGGKFSTSQKRGVFMDQALELLPGDYWRWYLIANSPESSDTAFTWESFKAGINSDLNDVLGNFVNRITAASPANTKRGWPTNSPPDCRTSSLTTKRWNSARPLPKPAPSGPPATNTSRSPPHGPPTRPASTRPPLASAPASTSSRSSASLPNRSSRKPRRKSSTHSTSPKPTAASLLRSSGRAATQLFSTRCPATCPSPSPRSSSPRSKTRRSPNGPPASTAADPRASRTTP